MSTVAVEVPPSVKLARNQQHAADLTLRVPPSHDAERTASAPAPASWNADPFGKLIGCCAIAAAFASYLVYPAIDTLVGV